MHRCSGMIFVLLTSVFSVMTMNTFGREVIVNDTIIFGGSVVTMDDRGTIAQAVWVKDGNIAAVGNKATVMQHVTAQTKLIDLQGGALLPGFIDPHLHVMVAALFTLMTDLTPCLPERYEKRPHCSVTIAKALLHLKNHPKPAGGTWIVGQGIDPSRMSTTDEASFFCKLHEKPAHCLEEHVSSEQPVFIFDASEHLAYVNRLAFVKAGLCDDVEHCPKNTESPPQPTDQSAHWVTDSSGHYTGLLMEGGAYGPFLRAIATQEPAMVSLEDPLAFITSAREVVRDIASTGVTTVVNGGAVSKTEIDFIRLLAERSLVNPHPVLRYRTLVKWSVARELKLQKTPVWNEDDHGQFGVYGIKLWADGSTQGCSADLQRAYSNGGLCSQAGKGHENYTQHEIAQHLRDFWNAGWYFNVHTNGDRAIRNVLGALATLAEETPSALPHTLLHTTVNGDPSTGEDMVQAMADLRAGKDRVKVNVRVSNLIAHVAYWGGALQNILDGTNGPQETNPHGRAAWVDATRRYTELGVPFSLHSDNPVSPVHPLWYVEQAVTRNTWFYPKLRDADVAVMPGSQNIPIYAALRAVTIEPARQHLLDPYIGSIEVGKVADLVILDKNPLEQEPNSLHNIKVLSTFVNGDQHAW